MNNISVKIIIDGELKPLNKESELIISEFKRFKIDSFNHSPDNFITTNEGIQKTQPSIHSLFGRDYVFEYPKKWAGKILDENLSHVHIDINNQWSENNAQWYCTSNESVVYSGFKLNSEKYCLVVHDLLTNEKDAPDFDAHNFYEEEDIEYYLKNSIYHREKITKK